MLYFDDQFPLHRKVDGLTDSAFRLHVEAIFWSRRNTSDGFLAQDDLPIVSRYRKPEGYAAECVKRGAWHRIESGRVVGECAECETRYGDVFAGRDGWLIHGFLDWQESRSKVLQLREVRQRAGRLGGIKSGKTRASRKKGNLLQPGFPENPQAMPPNEANSEANTKQRGAKQKRTPYPLPSTKEGRDARPASQGAASVPAAPPPLGPPRVNGRPSTPPPAAKALLDDAKAKIAAASRKIHAVVEERRAGAFDELLAIPTPAVSPPDPDAEPPADADPLPDEDTNGET
jgi:hypothetical protein